MTEDELRPVPAKGWAEMIRKGYEVDPLLCPQCGRTMRVISFLTDYAVVDRIIDHLRLTFVAERPGPSIFRDSFIPGEGKSSSFPALFGAGTAPIRSPLTLNPSLTRLDGPIYASPRWLEGKIGA